MSEGVNAQEKARKLSELANASLKAQDYSACLRSLEELSKLRPDDPEVRNNVLVAEALQGGEPPGQAFLNKLQAEASKVLTQEKARQNVCLLMNTATILSHAQQHRAAQQLLEPLVGLLSTTKQESSVLEHRHEEALLAACFLLLDTNLVLEKYSAAADVVSLLEQRYDLQSDDREDGTEASIESSNHSAGSSPATNQASVVCGYNLLQLVLGYKARLHLLTGSIKSAKRDIKHLLALDPRHPQAVALKADLELFRGNLKRAGKLNMTCVSEGQTASPAEVLQMLTNMALIQHKQGNHCSAALCYANALDCAKQANLPGPLQVKPDGPLLADSLYNSTWTSLYAVGVQGLEQGPYTEAFRNFQFCEETLSGIPHTPLRIAECCCRAAVEGQAIPLSTGDPNGASQPATVVRTLEFGRQKATDALDLYTAARDSLSDDLNSSQLQNTSHSETSLENTELPFLDAVRVYERQLYSTGIQDCLCKLAFISLKLGDNSAALEYAQRVSQMEEVDSEHFVAAKEYAAEALRKLDRLDEALTQLQEAFGKTLEPSCTKVPAAERGQSQEVAADSDVLSLKNEKEQKQVSLLVNMASAYCSLGDLRQAEALAEEAAKAEDNEDALLMHVYTLLCTGQTATALSKLKKLHNS